MKYVIGLLLFMMLNAVLWVPGGRTEEISGDPPMVLSIEQAVFMALERNRDLMVRVIDPKIRETVIGENKGIFDLDLSAQLNAEKSESENEGAQKNTLNLFQNLLIIFPNLETQFPDLRQRIDEKMTEENTAENTTQAGEGTLSLSKLFSPGTKLNLELKTRYSDTESIDQQNPDLNFASSGYTTSAAFTLTQPIMQGMGKKITLSLVEQSELDKKISIYELNQYVMELVAKVQKTYWDLILAKKTLTIRQKSMKLAEDQLAETEERINIGKLPESELSAALAEVAAEKRKLIDAESAEAQKKLSFILLLNPETYIPWEQSLKLTTSPKPLEIKTGPVQDHVSLAFNSRPDLGQAHLNLEKGNLEVVRTENGLLPRLDFFFTLKKTADESNNLPSYDDFDHSDYIAGLVFSRPWGNQKAENQFQRANLQRVKYQKSIEYLKQRIEVEVRQAILEFERYREQITASEANRKRQEEKVTVEQEKFRVGRSTNLLVFQAQRDLTEAQVGEVTAIVDQLKAYIDLQLAEGILLKKWSMEVTSPSL